MSKKQIVALGVFSRRLRSASYYWMIFGPLLMCLIIGGINYFVAKSVTKSEPKIAVVANPQAKAALLSLPTDGYRLDKKLTLTNQKQIKRALAQKKVDGVLVIKGDFKSARYLYQAGNDKNQPTQVLTAILSKLKSSLAAQKAGLSPKQWQEITAAVPLKTEVIRQSNQKSEDDKQIAKGISFVVVVILFLVVSSYIGIVGSELGNEKSSHLIEALLASVPAREHFSGKMLGIAYLISFQLVTYLLMGGLFYVGLQVAGYGKLVNDLHLEKYLTSFGPQFWLLICLIIVLSLVLYVLLAALLASFVSRVEDISQLSSMVGMLVMVPYIFALIAMYAPNVLAVKILSYLPFIINGPMVVRLALGEASLSAGWIAVGISALAAIGLYFLAVNAYQRNALTYSNKSLFVTLGQALRRK